MLEEFSDRRAPLLARQAVRSGYTASTAGQNQQWHTNFKTRSENVRHRWESKLKADSIREILYDQPFVPFRIHMGNGRSIEVRHPEMAIVTDQEVAVAAEEDGKSRLRLLALANINEVERIESGA